MKAGKKIVSKIVLCAILIFIFINAFWFIWRTQRYGDYGRKMETNPAATWMVPRYKLTDADGFDYGVKYPDYLSFTGNLSVGLPSNGDNLFTDGLIIWPKAFGGYEYGVALIEGDTEYQIYIHADGTAVDPENSEIVARNQEKIAVLLQKAEEMWNLEKKLSKAV